MLIPPDKANHGWWGPQRALWDALVDVPPLSYKEWVGAARARSSSFAPAASSPSSTSSSSSSPPLLIRVRRAVLALSGHHSVYGRGLIGRQLERVCEPCAAASSASRRLAPVSAFYRGLLGSVLERSNLLTLPRAPSAHARHATPLPAVWISRGKGHGGAYGKTVGRRCLNEPGVFDALARSDVPLSLTPLELADVPPSGSRMVHSHAVHLFLGALLTPCPMCVAQVPFARQLEHFRSAAVLTGMHGAGCARARPIARSLSPLPALWPTASPRALQVCQHDLP